MKDGKTPCVIDFSKPFSQISIMAALEEQLQSKLPSPFTDDGIAFTNKHGDLLTLSLTQTLQELF